MTGAGLLSEITRQLKPRLLLWCSYRDALLLCSSYRVALFDVVDVVAAEGRDRRHDRVSPAFGERGAPWEVGVGVGRWEVRLLH